MKGRDGMVHLIVVTHGDLGASLIRAVEMIAGKQEKVSACGLFPDQSRDDLKEELEHSLADNEKSFLILIDMYGGSPSITATMLAKGKSNIEVISGVNLPMILEAVMARDNLNLDELAEHLVESTQRSIVRVKKILDEAVEGGDLQS